MKLKRPEMRKARIEIIPMIDTIFFLLVFFMVTWLSMVKMNGLGLAMPHENHTSQPAPPSITLAISPRGAYYIDQRLAASSSWRDALKREILAHPNGVIVLNVAPALATQNLISTLDAVRGVIAETGTHTQILVATPHVKENGHVGH